MIPSYTWSFGPSVSMILSNFHADVAKNTTEVATLPPVVLHQSGMEESRRGGAAGRLGSP